MTDNTFTRVDLAQFDGFPAAEWYEEVDQYDEEGELETPMPNGDVYEACEDGAYIAHVYKRNATAIIVNAPRFLAALRAAYAENDRLNSDMDHRARLMAGMSMTSMRQRAEIDRLRAELNDAWMESGHDKATIDRLRASALTWTTVTDDPATLPEQDSERDVLVDTVRWDDGEPSEMRTYYVLHLESDSIENLSPRDTRRA